MSKKVDISLEVDPSYELPHVIIRTGRKTELIERMIDALERCVEEEYPEVVCYSGDSVVLLRQQDITRVYSENRKIVVCTDDERYDCKQTLSDLEEKLDPDTFVRISRFELINLKKVAGFDLNIAGTIKVYFKDRSETFVARRYVSLIQQKIKARIEGSKEK